ncbi:cation diffusion facilitator family transporter [Granulicoccus sp. GXG6511]|uniref:cation diffusion facilitator family transporter n=1 Tax=Granulicoccus sp. GXG6511 TaxID=3381351 RepID=UPI003D7CED0B
MDHVSDAPVARTATEPRPVDLTRFAWLSIMAAIATITLKAAAWLMTGSVGLLSDAAESVVNLVAAVVALMALRVAAAPASERFPYGRTKAEYFSAAIEGLMILVAASVIIVTAVERFLNPRPLEQVGIGLAISIIASVINGVVAAVLIRAGTKHRSLALTADGRHLLTDVWTSVGVVVGVGLVWITQWDRLDAIVAFVVGINIVITGVRLLTASAAGLLDVTLPDEENRAIIEILDRRTDGQVAFHGLMTRVAGQHRFATVHVLVPCEWTVKRGHDYVDDLEAELTKAVPGLRVLSHLEPDADPRSYEDQPTGAIQFDAARTEAPEDD